jgi:Cu/Ag efflux pump CusA
MMALFLSPFAIIAFWIAALAFQFRAARSRGRGAALATWARCVGVFLAVELLPHVCVAVVDDVSHLFGANEIARFAQSLYAPNVTASLMMSLVVSMVGSVVATTIYVAWLIDRFVPGLSKA